MIPIVKSHKETDFSVRKLQKQIDRNRAIKAVLSQITTEPISQPAAPLAPLSGEFPNVRLLTENYTARFDDDILICDGTFTVTLPFLDGEDNENDGFELTIINRTTGIITVAAATNNLINSATSYIMGAIYDAVIVTAYLSVYYLVEKPLNFEDYESVTSTTSGDKFLLELEGTGGTKRNIAYLHLLTEIESDLTFMNNLIDDLTPQAGGTLSMNSHMIEWSKGTDIASASSIALPTDGNYFDITGTTTIDGISNVITIKGTMVKFHFDGILTLVNTPGLLCPGGSITTAAGDECTLINYSSTFWIISSYTRADGTPLAVNIVDDTSPQLGGDLDPNGNDIQTLAAFSIGDGDSAGNDTELIVNDTGEIITLKGTAIRLTSSAIGATKHLLTDAFTDVIGTSQLIFIKGADLPSETNLTMPTDGNYIVITGTTTIETFASGIGIGTVLVFEFAGVLTIEDHSTILLPTGANITTQAGDVATFIEKSTGVYKCIFYQRQDGTALA